MRVKGAGIDIIRYSNPARLAAFLVEFMSALLLILTVVRRYRRSDQLIVTRLRNRAHDRFKAVPAKESSSNRLSILLCSYRFSFLLARSCFKVQTLLRRPPALFSCTY